MPNVIQTKPLENDKCNIRTLEIADETLARIKNNYKPKLTIQSKKIILKIIGWFNNWKVNPQQIGYFMTDIANSGYHNVAISILLTKLSYLRCQRYIFRLIKQYHNGLAYRFDDIVHMVEYMNQDALEAFDEHVHDVHSRADFNDLIFEYIKSTLDFDEMLDVTNMTKYWTEHEPKYSPRNVIIMYF